VDGLVKFFLESRRAAGETTLRLQDVKEGLSSLGLNDDLRFYGKFLGRNGCKFRQSRRGSYYELSNNNNEEGGVQ